MVKAIGFGKTQYQEITIQYVGCRRNFAFLLNFKLINNSDSNFSVLQRKLVGHGFEHQN